MINSIEEYLRQLKQELGATDRAMVQDALSDAEEYLRNAYADALQRTPGVSETSALPGIIAEYGTPEEVAAAYRNIETPVTPTAASLRKPEKRSPSARFFGVVAEPRAWGSLLYLLASLITGSIYFTWATFGLSISVGFLILIIGIPVAGLFLLSLRGLALVEGRLVEALLGIRMPRRPLFARKDLSLWGRFKSLVSDKYTWFALLYMLLMLPLGIFYFNVFITLFAGSLYLIALPVLQLGFGIPAFTNHGVDYFTPGWLMPIAVIAGIVLLFLVMHLSKMVGKWHGALAKTMLVRE